MATTPEKRATLEDLYRVEGKAELLTTSDGGAHWTDKVTLAGPMDLSWLPQGRNKVGDYISTVFCNGVAFPVFSIASEPDSVHLNEAIYTVNGGLTL